MLRQIESPRAIAISVTILAGLCVVIVILLLLYGVREVQVYRTTAELNQLRSEFDAYKIANDGKWLSHMDEHQGIERTLYDTTKTANLKAVPRRASYAEQWMLNTANELRRDNRDIKARLYRLEQR